MFHLVVWTLRVVVGFLYFNCMARPKKNNAEYFSHDAGMRNDEKVLALRSKFKNEGYAIWCMFLEILANEDGFKKEINTEVQKELLAGDLRVSVTEMQEILSFCSRIELLKEKKGVFWSDNLIKRLNPMVQKREFMRQKYEDKRVSDAETGVSGAETTQSKVKESKVKDNTAKAEFKYFYKEKNMETIELDESGEEIEPKSKFKLPRGFVVKLSKYYMQVFNIPETSGIYFNYKKTIDGMIELSQKKNGDDPENINKEIKTKIDNAKKKCDKEGWPKMKLSTILENWNIPEQEIKLDVSERRKL